MRVIWWKISRPELANGPVELVGDSLNIHLPEDWSPIDVLQHGDDPSNRDWLTRLLQWTEGSESQP